MPVPNNPFNGFAGPNTGRSDSPTGLGSPLRTGRGHASLARDLGELKPFAGYDSLAHRAAVVHLPNLRSASPELLGKMKDPSNQLLGSNGQLSLEQIAGPAANLPPNTPPISAAQQSAAQRLLSKIGTSATNGNAATGLTKDLEEREQILQDKIQRKATLLGNPLNSALPPESKIAMIQADYRDALKEVTSIGKERTRDIEDFFNDPANVTDLKTCYGLNDGDIARSRDNMLATAKAKEDEQRKQLEKAFQDAMDDQLRVLSDMEQIRAIQYINKFNPDPANQAGQMNFSIGSNAPELNQKKVYKSSNGVDIFCDGKGGTSMALPYSSWKRLFSRKGTAEGAQAWRDQILLHKAAGATTINLSAKKRTWNFDPDAQGEQDDPIALQQGWREAIQCGFAPDAITGYSPTSDDMKWYRQQVANFEDKHPRLSGPETVKAAQRTGAYLIEGKLSSVDAKINQLRTDIAQKLQNLQNLNPNDPQYAKNVADIMKLNEQLGNLQQHQLRQLRDLDRIYNNPNSTPEMQQAAIEFMQDYQPNLEAALHDQENINRQLQSHIDGVLAMGAGNHAPAWNDLNQELQRVEQQRQQDELDRQRLEQQMQVNAHNLGMTP